MHSASSRFNSITLYAGLIMAVMCLVNYFHGRLIYNPKPDIKFEITALPSFIPTVNWDQVSFRYNMHAGIFEAYEYRPQLLVHVESQTVVCVYLGIIC